MDNSGYTKLTLREFEDQEFKKATGRTFKTMVNPEKLLFNKKITYVEDKADGSDDSTLKFQKVETPELDLDFLFDGTGVIQNPGTEIKGAEGVANRINEFESILTGYNGETHRTSFLIATWGTFQFKGVVTDYSIEYKLFDKQGAPLRAIGKIKLKASIDELLAALKKGNESPDLTHIRQVVEGDTLPLLCHNIYGDPKYYLEVAKANNITNFRKLKPGQRINFPPVEKLST